MPLTDMERYIDEIDEDYYCPCVECLTWVLNQWFKKG